jgi:hypothetical protein
VDGFAIGVVIIQLMAAAGIVGFWLTAGRARFDEPWVIGLSSGLFCRLFVSTGLT